MNKYTQLNQTIRKIRNISCVTLCFLFSQNTFSQTTDGLKLSINGSPDLKINGNVVYNIGGEPKMLNVSVSDPIVCSLVSPPSGNVSLVLTDSNNTISTMANGLQSTLYNLTEKTISVKSGSSLECATGIEITENGNQVIQKGIYNEIIFNQGFDDKEGSSSDALSVTLLEESGEPPNLLYSPLTNKDLSDDTNLRYVYRITNNSTDPITLNFVEYYLVNNNGLGFGAGNWGINNSLVNTGVIKSDDLVIPESSTIDITATRKVVINDVQPNQKIILLAAAFLKNKKDAYLDNNVSYIEFGTTDDITPPDAPIITGISEDTGTAGDGITSDTTLNISGTSEAGASVEVFIGGVSLSTATADNSGNWVYDHTNTVLTEGSHVITAKATDAANNTSTISANFDVTVDITAPMVSITFPATSGSTNGTVSGTGESGTTINVSGPNSFNNLPTNCQAVVQTDSSWTCSLMDENMMPPNNQGNANISVKTNADIAGNEGMSMVNTITIDIIAPEAPTVVTLSTNDTTPTITGTNGLTTALPTGETMNVLVNGATYVVVPDGSGNWSLDTEMATPDSGTLGVFASNMTYEVVATVTDAAGNATSDTSSNEITITP